MSAGTDQAITGRLIVHRVKERNHQGDLFSIRRYHPFFTNSTEKVTDADMTRRNTAS